MTKDSWSYPWVACPLPSAGETITYHIGFKLVCYYNETCIVNTHVLAQAQEGRIFADTYARFTVLPVRASPSTRRTGRGPSATPSLVGMAATAPTGIGGLPVTGAPLVLFGVGTAVLLGAGAGLLLLARRRRSATG